MAGRLFSTVLAVVVRLKRIIVGPHYCSAVSGGGVITSCNDKPSSVARMVVNKPTMKTIDQRHTSFIPNAAV